MLHIESLSSPANICCCRWLKQERRWLSTAASFPPFPVQIGHVIVIGKYLQVPQSCVGWCFSGCLQTAQSVAAILLTWDSYFPVALFHFKSKFQQVWELKCNSHLSNVCPFFFFIFNLCFPSLNSEWFGCNRTVLLVGIYVLFFV